MARGLPTTAERQAMRRALALAARGTRAAPNPQVGAVVLGAAGEVVGEGWHEAAGQAHAEVVALAGAGARARGGTIVVTLEPCRHRGRTGPCTEAILAAGLRRVVFACPDPTPAGGGAAALTAGGLEVVGGVEESSAAELNVRWLTAVARRRPWVVWKLAATLDGRVAAADGTSRWISSAASRADAHLLRARCDTIVAGVGTVLADDPALTVRDEMGTPDRRQPQRVVVDTHGRTPAEAHVRDSSAPTWIATGRAVGTGSDGHVDLPALTHELYARGSRIALLEGGPRLAGAFLRDGLIDEVVAYLAPTLLGAGPAALAASHIRTLGHAVHLTPHDVRTLGPDIRLEARLTCSP